MSTVPTAKNTASSSKPTPTTIQGHSRRRPAFRAIVRRESAVCVPILGVYPFSRIVHYALVGARSDQPGLEREGGGRRIARVILVGVRVLS
jgi:hypothetical protein